MDGPEAAGSGMLAEAAGTAPFAASLATFLSLFLCANSFLLSAVFLLFATAASMFSLSCAASSSAVASRSPPSRSPPGSSVIFLPSFSTFFFVFLSPLLWFRLRSLCTWVERTSFKPSLVRVTKRWCLWRHTTPWHSWDRSLTGLGLWVMTWRCIWFTSSVHVGSADNHVSVSAFACSFENVWHHPPPRAS